MKASETREPMATIGRPPGAQRFENGLYYKTVGSQIYFHAGGEWRLDAPATKIQRQIDQARIEAAATTRQRAKKARAHSNPRGKKHA